MEKFGRFVLYFLACGILYVIMRFTWMHFGVDKLDGPTFWFALLFSFFVDLIYDAFYKWNKP